MTIRVYHFTHPVTGSATWTEHNNIDYYEVKDGFLYLYRKDPKAPIIYNMKTVTNITHSNFSRVYNSYHCRLY